MNLPADYALDQPALLLATLLPGAFLVVLLTRRLDLFRGHKAALLLLRLGVVAAISVATAGPVRLNPRAGPVLVLGIDASESYRVCAGDPGTVVSQALADFSPPPDLRTAVVVFAAEPKLTRPLAAGVPGPSDWPARGVPTGATDIEAGLGLMRSVVPVGDPGDVRFLLFTDGRQNQGDMLSPADGKCPPVHVWAGGLVPAPDARLSALRLPARAAPGAPVRGTATVTANTGGNVRVRVVRSTGGADTKAAVVVEQPLSLRVGVPDDVGFTDTPPAEGTWTYRAEVIPDGPDAVAANNSLTAAVTVSGAGRVLLVTREPAGALAAALRTLPGRTVEIAAPGNLSAAGADLARFETVVLDNLATDKAPADLLARLPAGGLLSTERVAALAGYVRDFGGGLVVFGGGDSFGPGGYHLSPINELLPVDSDPRSRNPVALAVVFDASGSMDRAVSGSDPRKRIEVAREAVLALRPPVLNTRDELTVIAFNATADVIRPLGPQADWTALTDRLRAVSPTGPTLFVPAVEAALRQLKDAKSANRRIVLISDGENDPVESGALTALAARFRQERVRLSVVISGERSKLLSELTAATGGAYYGPREFSEVPDRLIQDVFAAGEFVRVGPIKTRLVSAGPLTGLAALKAPPPLERMLRTVIRPEAAAAISAEDDDPVIAHRRFGLGRVVAVPTRLEKDWASAWQAGAGEVLGAILDWTMQPATEADFALVADIDGPRVRLELLHTPAADKLPANELRPLLRVVRPGDASASAGIEREMRQIGPGRYAADVELPEQGSFLAAAVAPGQPPRALGRTTFTTGHPPEITEIGFDEAALARLTGRTGGKFLYSMNDLSGWDGATGYRRSVAAWAIAAAFALAALELLMQIALRKGWL